MRIHQERDTLRRGRILDFPHQLGQIGERLCLFVELAFTGNRYQRASRLRGFYLTSAPHLAQQLDEDTAGIGANLGIASGLLPTLRNGRSRFIHHLLSQVIFPEANLAGLDRRERMRIHWGQRALYVGSLALLLLFGLLWAGGFSANHERLERLRELAQQWTQQRQALGERDDAMAALKTLDSSYAATAVFPPKGEVSLHERAGLYQGNEVNPPLAAAYRRELETQLLPRVARMLEAQIRGNMQNRERLLNSLRAYLMLNLRERRENGWLEDWVATDWSALCRQRHRAEWPEHAFRPSARATVQLSAERDPGGPGTPGAAQRVPGQRGLPGAARTGAKPARVSLRPAPGAAGRSVRRHRLRDPGLLHPAGLPAVLRGPGRQPGQRHPSRQLGSGRGQRDQRHGPAAPDGRTRAVVFPRLRELLERGGRTPGPAAVQRCRRGRRPGFRAARRQLTDPPVVAGGP